MVAVVVVMVIVVMEDLTFFDFFVLLCVSFVFPFVFLVCFFCVSFVIWCVGC